MIGPKRNTSILCAECQCEKPACEIYDICCEELLDGQTTSKSSDKSPKLYCDSDAAKDLHFLYIRSCSESYHGKNETRRLCLEDVSVAETTKDTFMRVIDTETQVVYFNMYCARCNNVTK
ncbi:hypothetical protein BgiBS90_037215, partial [Biomphalaria glabrata]